MLTEIQRKKISHLFDVLDINKNGSLQLDDFVSVSEEIIGQLGIDEQSRRAKLLRLKANRLFIQFVIDTDQTDMSISLVDWMRFFDNALVDPKENGPLRSYIFRTTFHLFSLFDLNNDKHISIEEYSNMLSVYKISPEHCERSFKQLDENDDLVISSDELVNGLNDYFTSSDPDAPGNMIFGDWQ